MTTGSTDLDAILTGSEARDVVEEVTAELDAADTESTHVGRDSTGELTTAPPAVEKPKDDTPSDHVPVRALQEERRKRQELEKRLSELEQAKPAEVKPNLFEDPDNWEKALDARLEQRLSAVRQESEQKFLVLVEQAAMARHTDFKDMAQVFAETAKVTPGLIDEARNAPDPAEFIYQAGRNLKRVQEAGSIEALIEKAREEGRQEALKGRVTPKIPESLTEITGAPAERQKSFEPKALDSLLPSI